MNPIAMQAQSPAMFAQAFGGAQGAPAQADVDRFRQLMANATPEAHADPSMGQTIVGKAIAEADGHWTKVANDLQYMMQQHPSPGESPQESIHRLNTEAMYVSAEMGAAYWDLQVKMALVKSTKGSVETLMKNQ